MHAAKARSPSGGVTNVQCRLRPGDCVCSAGALQINTETGTVRVGSAR